MGKKANKAQYESYSLLEVLNDTIQIPKKDVIIEQPPVNTGSSSSQTDVKISKIRQLYRYYEELYFLMRFVIKREKQSYLYKKIAVYDEDGVAEIINTWYLPIDERIRLHENMLNMLKKY